MTQSRRVKRGLLLLIFGFSLSIGCTTTGGAKPKVEGKPKVVERQKVPVPQDVLIGGYCPVAYVDSGKPVAGVPEFSVEEEIGVYWFVNEGAKQAYLKDRQGYQIYFEGWDPVGLAQGEYLATDPLVFWSDPDQGGTYLFEDQASLETFKQERAQVLAKALKFWAEQ